MDIILGRRISRRILRRQRRLSRGAGGLIGKIGAEGSGISPKVSSTKC